MYEVRAAIIPLEEVASVLFSGLVPGSSGNCRLLEVLTRRDISWRRFVHEDVPTSRAMPEGSQCRLLRTCNTLDRNRSFPPQKSCARWNH